MVETLPLFPLGTVLFPGLVLPLHVFEERYRLLVRELLALPEGTGRRFGVVAIRYGDEVGAEALPTLYDHGCTALLSRVEPHPDGRFDIVTYGGQRFRLHEIDGTLPYLRGAVTPLDEPVGADAEAAALGRAVRGVFPAYLGMLASARGGNAEVPELPTDPTVLSYLVAAALAVDLHDRQRLLAAPDAVARLRAELALLRRERALLRALPAAPAPDLARLRFSPN